MHNFDHSAEQDDVKKDLMSKDTKQLHYDKMYELVCEFVHTLEFEFESVRS